MNSYSQNGNLTKDNIEGRVRQLVLEESKKRGGEKEYKKIMEYVRSVRIEGKAAVAMADRILSWLHKAMKVKVWR